MSALEMIDQLQSLNNSERLQVIEAATRLIREELSTSHESPREDRNRRMREQALAAKEWYEPGGELTEWTSLDAEDFLDDYVRIAEGGAS